MLDFQAAKEKIRGSLRHANHGHSIPKPKKNVTKKHFTMEGPPKASKSQIELAQFAEAPGKPKKMHTCKHKVDSKECGLQFSSYHQLCMHKNLVGHKQKSNAKNEDETRNSRQKRVRSFNQNLDEFLVQAAAEKSSSSSDEDTIKDRGNANQSDEEEMTVNSNKDEQEDEEDEACMFCGKLEPEIMKTTR